jgi:hypothetical protein
MGKFSKNQEVLRVQNIGNFWTQNYQIVKEEIYSCGKKQIILKDSDGGRGEKVSLTWFEENEIVVPFFSKGDIEKAKELKQILSKEAQIKVEKRIARIGH